MSIVDHHDRALIAEAVDRNLCVEAGAGTGKTTSMVARVASILSAGSVGGQPIDVDHMAIITFTDFAAAELMTRVRERLEDLVDSGDAPDPGRIEVALRNLHRAHVETIHAFCISLLRERPVEAGLDPQFTPMDDMESGIQFDAFYFDWLQRRLHEGGQALAVAIDRGFGLKQIRRLVEGVNLHRAVLPLAPINAPDPDIDRLLENMRRTAAGLRGITEYCTAKDDKALPQIDNALAWLTELLERADADPEHHDVVRFLLAAAPKVTVGNGKKDNWGEQIEEMRRLLRAVKDGAADAATALRTHAIVGVLKEAEGFALEYEAERRRLGVADFDDILLWTRRMLRESREARDYFRRRFPVLMVDEFQDTDPVQAEIILTIASDDEPGDDWLAMRPRPGGLTVVGDPKQSIYRFRRADITMYEEIRTGPLDGGQAQLVQNFRSVPEVIEWVNSTFNILLVQTDKVQPGNLPLAAHRDSLEHPHLAVTLLRGDIDPDARADDERAAEADALAAMLRKVLDDAWPVLGAPDHAGQRHMRAVQPKDIAVLVRSWTDVDVFVRALRRAGIKALTSGGKLFFNRQEVRDLANVLTALHDPLDQVALVAALRSQAFGCSDEELLLWKMSGGPVDYRWSKAVDPPARVKAAMATMKRLYQRTLQVSLPVLVREVVEELRLIDIVLAGTGGPQAAANVMRLVEQARRFSASGSGGLRQFAAWLARQREEEQEGDARIAEKADGAVLITTIHGSKGLEFPVVALANLGIPRKKVHEPIPDRKNNLIHVRVKGNSDHEEFFTPGYEQHSDREDVHNDAEDVRLLYVAATRARDHLIVSQMQSPKMNAKGDKGEKTLRALLHPHLPFSTGVHGREKDGVHVVDAAELPPLPDDPLLRDPEADAHEVAKALADRAEWIANNERVKVEASVALTITRPTDESGHRDEMDLDSTFDWGTPLIVGARAGAKVGEALHQVMEVVDLAKPGDIGPLVHSICQAEGLADQADDVEAMAEACLASDAVKRAVAANEAWREVPYMVTTNDGFESGRIDLLIREGDELTVIDWKSDSVGLDAVQQGAESHRGQAECYASALQRITKMPVKEVIFVFARAKAQAAITDLPDPELEVGR